MCRIHKPMPTEEIDALKAQHAQARAVYFETQGVSGAEQYRRRVEIAEKYKAMADLSAAIDAGLRSWRCAFIQCEPETGEVNSL